MGDKRDNTLQAHDTPHIPLNTPEAFFTRELARTHAEILLNQFNLLYMETMDKHWDSHTVISYVMNVQLQVFANVLYSLAHTIPLEEREDFLRQLIAAFEQHATAWVTKVLRQDQTP